MKKSEKNPLTVVGTWLFVMLRVCSNPRQAMKKKPNAGGRPPKSDDKKKLKISVSLDPVLVEFVKKTGDALGDSVSHIIESIIRSRYNLAANGDDGNGSAGNGLQMTVDQSRSK